MKARKIFKLVALMFAASMVHTIARGETPKDTLVIAKDIADIISLDPAEVFEQTGTELIGNIYDRVMTYDAEDLTSLVGGVAESHEVVEGGKSMVLKIRPGLTFHSGNPVTAADVAFSLQRVVKLNKTPSFIITQFGWTADNVDELVKAADAATVKLTFANQLSPSLVLNALASGVGSVVDMKEVMTHEENGDFGHGWLKNHSAGSGPYKLKDWKANDIVIIEGNPDFRKGAPATNRVILRHIPEPSAQRLLLEQGDVDMARNLTPDQIKGLAGNSDVIVTEYPKAALIYVGVNNGHELLGRPQIREAIRYLIDYEGMVQSFLAGQYIVHQAFWPSGLWAANDETPFSLDMEKARALVAEAGLPEGGAKVTIDTLKFSPFPEIAQSLQQNLREVGIEANIILSEGKTFWPKYRARKHEIVIARYAPDYIDPHSNADAFAHNPDNSEQAQLTGKLAWRNNWQNLEVNALVEQAAKEGGAEKRMQQYLDLQRRLQTDSPYSFMFQLNDQVATRKGVKGFVDGPLYDLVYYRAVTK